MQRGTKYVLVLLNLVVIALIVVILVGKDTSKTTSVENLGQVVVKGKQQEQQATNNQKQHENKEMIASAKLKCLNLFRNGMEPLTVESNNTEDWQNLRCDEMFCRNSRTTSGICQWSYLAIDTLLENASRICDTNLVEQFFPDPYWDAYRFSDYIKGRRQEENHDMPKRYPNSIVALFQKHLQDFLNSQKGQQQQQQNNDPSRRQILAKVIAQRIVETPRHKKPQPNTLVIHLRLGDVVDGALDSVRDLLLEQKYYFRRCNNETNEFCEEPWKTPYRYNPPAIYNFNKYVKPLQYYSSLEGLDNDYSNVVLMGSAHMGKYYKRDATKSCHYTIALQSYFQRRLPPKVNVTLRLGHPPDEDIIFAALADRFIKGGGGFSPELERLNIQGRRGMFQRIIRAEIRKGRGGWNGQKK